MLIPAWISNHPVRCGMKFIIHSQTSMVATINVWEWISNFTSLYNGCNYLSMLELKLIHVSKCDPWLYYIQCSNCKGDTQIRPWTNDRAHISLVQTFIIILFWAEKKARPHCTISIMCGCLMWEWNKVLQYCMLANINSTVVWVGHCWKTYKKHFAFHGSADII